MANINNTSSYMESQIIPIEMLLKFQPFSLKPEGSKGSTRKCRLQTFKKNLKKWAMNKTSKNISPGYCS